jgi:hypothetical protein
MKTLHLSIIVIVFLVFSGINFVFAQKTASVALVFLRPDKEIYFPGDSVFIHGQDDMNVTSITIGLEKDHKVMVSSEDSQVLKNGTFYANFTLPRDSDAKYWSLVSGPLHQDLYFKPVYLSPLEQFREGIAANDVKCEQGLQLVIKSEDGSPACVTSDTSSILVQRGWTHDNIVLQKNLLHIIIPLLNDTNSGKSEATNENKTSPTLQLFLSVDSGYENPAWPVSIDIALNNTGSVPLTLEKSDNWPRNDLTSGMCSNLPFGISILKGYYTEQNMSSARSLVIYQLVPCPMPTLIKSYTFQPLSSMATQKCDSLFSCPGLTDMKAHLVIPDFMDNGQHHSFDVGPYTIVGGDEWGHVAIQHFTEEYATAYSNQIGK